MSPDPAAGYIGTFILGMVAMVWLLALGKGSGRRRSAGKPWQAKRRRHKIIN